VYDVNGREAVEAEPLLEALKPSLEQYIYCSSAGVYLKNDQMPHREEDAVDPKSRHKVLGGGGGGGGVEGRVVQTCCMNRLLQTHKAPCSTALNM